MKSEHLMTAFLTTALLATTVQASRVYFGTTKSQGIYFSDFDTETGNLTPPKLAVETMGCGFIAIHPNKHFLYSTGTSAFKINADGTLPLLNTQTTDGGGACHVSIDKTGQCVMAAYYGGGAVASFHTLNDGSLSGVKSMFKHTGSGEHPKRQKKPYAHSIFTNPDNTFAYACDLGIDKVMIYRLNPSEGTLTPAGEAVVPGGSMGPRHLKWSKDGNYVYVLNELDLSISVFKSAGQNGSLQFLETVSTLSDEAQRNGMTSAEIRIHPNGKFIYASNRDVISSGRDSITIFKRYEDGFQRIKTVPAEVSVPRNFNIDPSGKWLLAAGQNSKEIAVFSVDPTTGLIHFTGEKVPFKGEPICVEFLAD